jgi:hypothetical protein
MPPGHPRSGPDCTVKTIPLGKILCLAEGEGRNAVFLAQQGYQVTAVDQSSVGLEKTRTKNSTLE